MSERTTSTPEVLCGAPVPKTAFLVRVIGVLLLSGAIPIQSQEINTNISSTDLTELPLEALMEIEVPEVYGASKFEQKTTEAPSSITIITSEEIQKYGYQTLADVLRSVSGLYVTYDRNYDFLGFRGIELGDFNSRFLVLVDGHRINNNLNDGADIGTAFILDIDLVDRVEIIRGPGSVLYGNNAFFGVINVITRQGRQLNKGEIAGEYGSFNAVRGRVTYGTLLTNGLELLFSGTIYHSDGPDELYYRAYDTPAQNNGIAENLDDDQFASVFGSADYRGFTLQGGFVHREKGNPTAQYFTTFNDPRLRTTDERSYALLKYAHEFSDVGNLTAQIYYDRADFMIDYPFGSVVYEETQVGEWWGTELQFDKKLWDRHTVTVGAEYRYDFRQELQITDPATGQLYTDIHRTRQSYGVYLQGDFAILTNLHFNGGVRYDQYGDFDPDFNPRLALIYHPFKESTFKAIYGTAFRVPNFQELADPRFQDIHPEKITAYEFVYEQGIGRHLRSSVCVFYNEMDDLILFESGSYTNFDADTAGMELGLEGLWGKGLRTRASYTLANAQSRTDGIYLPDSPEHLVKLNVSAPVLKDKVFAGLEFLYSSSRRTVASTTTGDFVAGQDVSGFGIVNLTFFSPNLVKNLEMSASVYNLLDRSYSDPSTRFHIQDHIPQDGRTFRVKLTYRF